MSMRFELHRSVRWDGDQLSDREYFGARAAYYRHLSRLKFSGNKTLLRYFGDSFFHDSTVLRVHFCRQSSVLELQIVTLNDLEDINAYRRRKQLRPIPRYRYLRKPVIYECRFTGVTINSDILSRLRNRPRPVRIMDTELEKAGAKNEFLVRISLGPDSGIEFTCHTCSVRITDRSRIFRYIGRQKQNLPRCALCRSKLLNPAKVLRVLRDAEKRGRGTLA